MIGTSRVALPSEQRCSIGGDVVAPGALLILFAAVIGFLLFGCTGMHPGTDAISNGSQKIKEKVMTWPGGFAVRLSTGLLLLLAILCGSGTGNLLAQSFRGAIRGELTDAHGLHVAGAKVVARNLGTSETREVTADGDGLYRFLEMAAGEYEVSALASGFEEVRAPQVRVEVGIDTVVNLTLSQVKGHQERVEVIESVPLMETSSTTLSQVVDRKLVQELPLNGRDFGKLVALAPGVTVDPSGVAGTEKGFGQFNINGNRDRSNNYTLDGTDNNDPFFNNSALNQVGITGAPATLLPLDAIQEFNLQSQFAAEYGRNSGSVVNVVTRSGSNSVHGSLYEYNRNSALDSRNYFNVTSKPDGSPNPKTPFNNNNFGGSLGGPIKKDRIFFFGAYEGQRETVGSDFDLFVPTLADIATAKAEALSYAASNSLTIVTAPLDKILSYLPTTTDQANHTLPYTVSDTNNNNNFIVKADVNVTPNNTFTARYAFGQSQQAFPLGSPSNAGGSRIATFEQISPTRVQVLSASWLATFSSTRINELRFGYSRFRTSFNSADGAPGNPNYIAPGGTGLDFGTALPGLPEIDFNGYFDNLGATAYSLPRGRVSQTYQVLDNFTWTRGHHTVKFGGEYHRYLVQSYNDNLGRGLVVVNGPGIDTNPYIDELIGFYLGNLGSYANTFANTGNTNRNTFNNNFGFFAQDEWRVLSNVTVIAGLRWEYFGPLGEKNNLLSNFDASGNLVPVGSPTLPHVYNRDLNNFAPRLGITWSPKAQTVVRAAYGIYYDYAPQNNLIANYTNSAGLATNPVPALLASGSPYFVGGMNYNSSAWTGGAAAGSVFTPITDQTTQSVFITDLNLRTPYVQNWNVNVQRQVAKTVAVEIGYVGSKGTKLTRLYDKNQDFSNPNWSAIDVFSGGANSTYNAVETTMRLYGFHGFSGFSTYAFGKSLDGASDGIDFNFATAAFPQNSDNLRAEKGPSTFDTRNRWTTAMNYDVPVAHSLPHALAAGWQLNTVITIQSGRPIPIVNSNDTSNTFNYHQRPNVVPGVHPVLPNWSPTSGYLNALAFAQPATGTFGSLGRDQIYGPGFMNFDFSVTKNFGIREKMKLQLRAEMFNIFNHPNFALPSNVITPGINADGSVNTTAGPAGVITQTPDVAQGNPGLGGGGPRVMQLGIRLEF
jgi:Carboxypeptidase regulatory-like domain/TonB-dependent Receptor Plug Domain